MTRFKLLGATAIVLSAALATPSMAKDMKDMKTDHAKKEMRMTPQRMHPRHMARRDDMARRDNDMAYRNDNNGWNNGRNTGFWPADAAAGVVGGAVAATGAAVDTAGRIATAPFQDDSYAYNNNGYNNNYAYNSSYNDNWSWNGNRRDSGFWPADAAAGVVDGAVNTAGAIATAPFRGDSYAYYNNGYQNNGYDNGWNGQTYAQRNGFVCQPGTWFKGDDGRRHICQ